MGSTINTRLFLKKSSRRRDDPKPFPTQNSTDTKPVIIPSVKQEVKPTFNPVVKDIVFKKTEDKPSDKSVDNPQDNKPAVEKIEPIELSSADKPVAIDLMDLNPTTVITDIATDVVTNTADAVVEKAKDIINSFTLEELPSHDLDFATSWYYTNFNDINPDNITLEYNANLQAMKELRDGTLKLPEGFDGKDIAYQLDTHILREFREKQLKYNPDDNLVHRAWFAHCVKRALIDLRDGIYSNPDGEEITEPKIASILERRINEIILENTLYKSQ